MSGLENENKTINFNGSKYGQKINVRISTDTCIGEIEDLLKNHERLIHELESNLCEIASKFPKVNIDIV